MEINKPLHRERKKVPVKAYGVTPKYSKWYMLKEINKILRNRINNFHVNSHASYVWEPEFFQVLADPVSCLFKHHLAHEMENFYKC